MNCFFIISNKIKSFLTIVFIFTLAFLSCSNGITEMREDLLGEERVDTTEDTTEEPTLQVLDASSMGVNEKWKKLKEIVAAANSGDIITIKGEILATNSPENYDEIVIDKKLTIKGSGAGATINANCTVSTNKHRIFKIESGGDLTIEDITLTGGNNFNGGGVYVDSGGALTMNSGSTISGNTAERSSPTGPRGGGGVCLLGTLTMNSGSTISGNTTNGQGAGVVLKESSSTFIMNGGTIKGNTLTGAYSKCGGVYVTKGIFKMKGGAQVGTYSGGILTDNNTVFLRVNQKITIIDDLTANSVATIEPESYPSGSSSVIALGGSLTGGSPKNYSRFKVKDEAGGKKWNVDSHGRLRKLLAPPTTWAGLKEQLEDHNGPLEIALTGSITANTSTGTGKIVVTRTVTIKGPSGGCTLNADCKTTGIKHRIFSISTGGNLTIENLTLMGGNVADTGNYRGGAVLIGGGTFIMGSGSLITGNKADYGGAVYIGGGQFKMQSGEISGNFGENGGGVFVENGGTFTMTGGVVKGNKNKAENQNRSAVKIDYSSSHFQMAGAAQLGAHNFSGGLTDGNTVFLNPNCVIELLAPLHSSFSGTNPAATIELSNGDYNPGRRVLADNSYVGDAYKFKVKPWGGKNWRIDSSGKLIQQ